MNGHNMYECMNWHNMLYVCMNGHNMLYELAQYVAQHIVLLHICDISHSHV